MEQQELERIEGISEPDPPLSHSGYTCLFGIGALIVAVIVALIAPFSVVFWYGLSILSLVIMGCAILFICLTGSEMPMYYHDLNLPLPGPRVTIIQMLGFAFFFFLAGLLQIDHVLWFSRSLLSPIVASVMFWMWACAKCLIAAPFIFKVIRYFQAFYLLLSSRTSQQEQRNERRNR